MQKDIRTIYKRRARFYFFWHLLTTLGHCHFVWRPKVARIVASKAKEANKTNPSPFRVLDVCTGWGLSMTATVKEFRRQRLEDPLIVGIDLTVEMMEEGKRQSWITGSGRYGLKYVNADARHLPFPNDAFDAIQVVCGIGGIPKEKRTDIFREFLRVLKPNGTLVLLDVVQLSFKTFGFGLLKSIEDTLTVRVLKWWGWENHPPLEKELRQAGFKILGNERYTEPLYPPAHIQMVRAVKQSHRGGLLLLLFCFYYLCYLKIITLYGTHLACPCFSGNPQFSPGNLYPAPEVPYQGTSCLCHNGLFCWPLVFFIVYGRGKFY